PPRRVPPLSGVGRVRRQPPDGAAVRVALPSIAPDVAVRDRPSPAGLRCGRRVPPVQAPSPGLLSRSAVSFRPRYLITTGPCHRAGVPCFQGSLKIARDRALPPAAASFF